MKRILIFYFTFFLFCKNIQAQNWSFGTTLNLGISNVTGITSFPYTTSNEFGFVKSGSIGFFTERKLKKYLAIGSELLWIQIEGRERLTGKKLESKESSSRRYFS